MAVPLDEVWGDSFSSPPVPRAASPPPPRPRRRRSSKRALAYGDEEEEEDVEEENDAGRGARRASSVAQLALELREMRSLFARQQAEQKTVLYAAIGVVVLLLLFTAHSYARLQHASDCMLQWRR